MAISNVRLEPLAVTDESPTIRVGSTGLRGIAAGRTGLGFSVLNVTTAASTAVIAGDVGVVFSFGSLSVSVYMGSTRIATARTLSFTDGDGGTELGSLVIPVTDDASNFALHYKVLFEPIVSLTSGNGLFSVLTGALGTSGFYNVMGIVWKV